MSRLRYPIAAALLVVLFAREGSGQQAGDPKTKPTFSETTEVTASRVEESIAQAPVSISVIDQRQIDAAAGANYADLLRGVPGVNVVQTSARDIGIRTRGSSGVAEHRQLTLMDGRSIYLDFYGIVLWDAMPVRLDEINQIEIQRGPGSALWGPNALSGVINVRTKSPRELDGGMISVRAGDRGTREASIRWADAFEQFSYKASASYLEQDAWPRDDALLPNGTPTPFAYHFQNRGTKQPKMDLRLDWGADSTPLWSFKLGYGGSTGIFHSRLGPFLVQPGTYAGFAEVDRNTLAMETKVYWNRLHGDAPNLINGLDFSFGTDTYAAETTGHRAIGSNQALVYGGDLRFTRFNLSIAPRGRARKEAGIFVEDSMLLHKNLTVTGGVRADHFTTYGTVVSPRLSFVFQTVHDQWLHLAYNRAYRMPSVADNFLETSIPSSLSLNGIPFVFQTQATGNEKLKREQVDAFELGYNITVGRRSLLTASIYRNVLKNNIVFVPTLFYSPADPPAGWPGPPKSVPPSLLPKVFTFLNVGTIVDSGFEASWDTSWTDALSMKTSYTLQAPPRVSTTAITVNHPPRHQASASMTFRHGRWFTSAATTFTDRAFWADVLDRRFWGATKAYFLVDGMTGWHLGARSDLTLSATNILDRKIKEHIFGDVVGRIATVALRYRF